MLASHGNEILRSCFSLMLILIFPLAAAEGGSPQSFRRLPPSGGRLLGARKRNDKGHIHTFAIDCLDGTMQF